MRHYRKCEKCGKSWWSRHECKGTSHFAPSIISISFQEFFPVKEFLWEEMELASSFPTNGREDTSFSYWVYTHKRMTKNQENLLQAFLKGLRHK